jgi:hypothetical protein
MGTHLEGERLPDATTGFIIVKSFVFVLKLQNGQAAMREAQ